MKIAIIETNCEVVKSLKGMIKTYFPGSEIECFTTQYKEVLKSYYEICFIAVVLHNDIGITLALEYEKQYPRTKLVFMSEYEQRVYDIFQSNPFFFLRKSQLDKEMEKFYKKYTKVKYRNNKKITLICNHHKTDIFIQDIVYIVSARNICFITTVDNQCYQNYNSLKKIMEQLCTSTNDFFKVNYQEIINFRYIKNIDKEFVYLTNKITAKLSRESKKRVCSAYYQYLLKNSNNMVNY